MPIDLNRFRLRNVLPPSLTGARPYEEDEEGNIRPVTEDTVSPVPIPKTAPIASTTSTTSKFTIPGQDDTESPTRAKLNELLTNPPLESQYKPSRGRKILGGIVGGLTGASRGGEVGAKLASDIVDAPYNRAKGEWEGQVGPLLKMDELERLRKREQTAGLSDIASYLRAQHDIESDTPEHQRLLSEAKARGEMTVKAPIEEQQMITKAGIDKVAAARAQSDRKEILSMEEQGRNKRATDEAVWRGKENALDRASRERIAARANEARKEIADANRKATAANKKTRVSVDQQVKAREDAEYRTLRESSDDELAAIADPVRDTHGNIVSYTLKPKSKIKDKGWLKTWEIRRDDAARMADKMLGEAFNPNQDEEEDTDMGPWEDITEQ